MCRPLKSWSVQTMSLRLLTCGALEWWCGKCLPSAIPLKTFRLSRSWTDWSRTASMWMCDPYVYRCTWNTVENHRQNICLEHFHYDLVCCIMHQIIWEHVLTGSRNFNHHKYVTCISRGLPNTWCRGMWVWCHQKSTLQTIPKSSNSAPQNTEGFGARHRRWLGKTWTWINRIWHAFLCGITLNETQPLKEMFLFRRQRRLTYACAWNRIDKIHSQGFVQTWYVQGWQDARKKRRLVRMVYLRQPSFFSKEFHVDWSIVVCTSACECGKTVSYLCVWCRFLLRWKMNGPTSWSYAKFVTPRKDPPWLTLLKCSIAFWRSCLNGIVCYYLLLWAAYACM